MTEAAETGEGSRPGKGTPAEVFQAFLKLGFTSFGGPIAHLGYFRHELVERRQWIDEKGYADLIALCQFLPGPASSQVGFALGLLRGGPLGALAAFLAFTLPSALLLVLFAYAAGSIDGPIGSGIIDGLKIVAVAIVGHAVLGMARSLCPDRKRATIALGAVFLALLVGGSIGQVGAIVLGALAGLVVCRAASDDTVVDIAFPVTKGQGMVALVAFAALLVVLPLLAAASSSQTVGLIDVFYRAGALVFGGGHVVLPLLQAGTVENGWISADSFLAGYGAAQAVPGPLFTFAAYLGYALEPSPNGVLGATLALIAIFLPGFLILIGTIPFWDAFRTKPNAQALMRGTNAAVVGILGAALYSPVFTSAVVSPAAFVLALTGFILLAVWKTPPWIVVVISALGGVVISFAG